MALTDSERELLQNTHDAVTAIQSTCIDCRRRIDRNERAIFGNSRYGLITNMRVVMLLGGFCSIVAAGVVVHWLASLVNG